MPHCLCKHFCAGTKQLTDAPNAPHMHPVALVCAVCTNPPSLLGYRKSFFLIMSTWIRIHEKSRHEIISVASEKFDLKLANGREVLNFPREFEFTCSCALHACMRIRIFQKERIRIHVRVQIACTHAHACMQKVLNFPREFEFTYTLHACMHVRIPFS